MNRFQRRKMKKGISGKLFVNPGTENVDRSAAQYCWLHKLHLDNIDKPTERDKKLMESVRFKPFKSEEKNGIKHLGRMCPRCKNVLYAKSSLEETAKSSILNNEDRNKNANIYLPDLPR